MRYIIWLLLLVLIFLRFQTTRPSFIDGQKIRITTKVNSEPLRFETSQRITVSGLKVYLPAFPEIHYGDRIVVEGWVAAGPEGLWPGGRNYKLTEVSLIEIRENRGLLYKLRRKLVQAYQVSLPEPHAALVAGITLGSKANLPTGFWEALKNTGTAHVVVASGMNVTMVAQFLVLLFILFLPRAKAVIFALVGVWVYALISGLEAPIVRAAIMGSLAFAAQGLGRLSTAWRGLVLSVIAMLLIRPDWITDLGFILSVVATASLLLFERKIRNLIQFLPGILREGLSTSFAAQIGVAPILFITFGQYSLLSPLVNAAVLWTVAPIMTIGALGAFTALAIPILGKLILYLSFPLTSWFIFVVKLFG